MKFEQLSSSLKTNVLAVYYAKGEDAFLLNKCAEMLHNACGTDLPDFNYSTFDDDNFSVSKALDSCMQFPIANLKRFVHIKNVSAKLTDDDKRAVLNYLQNPQETTCLLVSATNLNNSWDFLKSKATEIDCKRLSLNFTLKFVVAEAKKHNKQISEKAATELIKACAFDLNKISLEVHKLSSYFYNEQIIQSEAIAQLVMSTNEFAAFELSDAIASKNATKTWTMIYDMMQEKKDATFGIIGLLSSHFRRMLYAVVSPLSAAEVASLLGVKEFAIIKAREQKNKFSPLALKQIVDICVETEYCIKSGKMSAENALTFLVVKLLGA